jgi:hypothetical protein
VLYDAHMWRRHGVEHVRLGRVGRGGGPGHGKVVLVKVEALHQVADSLGLEAGQAGVAKSLAGGEELGRRRRRRGGSKGGE